MEYLKDNQYYIDLYDLSTIKQCLKANDAWTQVYSKHSKEDVAKGFSIGDVAKGFNWIANQEEFLIIGERYRKKEETIQKWILDDQIMQEKHDNTPEPSGINCPDCKKISHSRSKILETFGDSLRMMFLFECPLCKKKRWIYEDGSEQESSPDLCTKCKAEVEISIIKEGKDKVIWKTICSSCGFKEATVDDFKKSRLEREKEKENNNKLLEKYRELFCSEENGKKYFDYVESLKVASEVYEEELKKYDSSAYQKVSQLKKLSIGELEKILNNLFEKEQYIKLSLGNPEIGQHVIVTFTVQDADLTREKNISTDNLRKIIKGCLDGTNWRLMSDGLSYRLGYISGRLKGYESEEDFFELSGKKKEEQPSKIDYETRNKYAGHNTVQLARMMGEFKGINNIRERRLKNEPNGFFLESKDDHYSCGICGESTPGDKTWWNLDGVRCADCQRNIMEGVIPSEIHKNRDLWIKDWELSYENEFDIHPSTVRKLKREGFLRGRELKREDGTVYFTVYLNKENKELIEKYPRKHKQTFTITDLLGNKIEL